LTIVLMVVAVALVALLVGALRGRGVDRGPTGAGRGTPPEVGNN
jgi:hypothetical protein